MKIKSMFCFILCVVMLMLPVWGEVSAQEILPYADTEFDSATTVLKSTKQVSFRCATYSTKNSISVTNCWLEMENSDGSWSYVCALTPPSIVYTNTFAYSATVDYSDNIGTGTYRVWATYDADGHSITRCSNERTY